MGRSGEYQGRRRFTETALRSMPLVAAQEARNISRGRFGGSGMAAVCPDIPRSSIVRKERTDVDYFDVAEWGQGRVHRGL